MRIEDETEEEAIRQCDYVGKYMEAMDRDDEEAMAKYRRLIKLTPGNLMAMKILCGANYIREMGYNTEYADAEYGLGWLDRKEDRDYSDEYLPYLR